MDFIKSTRNIQNNQSGSICIIAGFTVLFRRKRREQRAELERLKKEVAKVETDIGHFEKKFSNENFVKNAPKDVLEKDMAKNEELKNKLASLKDSVSRLS